MTNLFYLIRRLSRPYYFPQIDTIMFFKSNFFKSFLIFIQKKEKPGWMGPGQL